MEERGLFESSAVERVEPVDQGRKEGQKESIETYATEAKNIGKLYGKRVGEEIGIYLGLLQVLNDQSEAQEAREEKDALKKRISFAEKLLSAFIAREPFDEVSQAKLKRIRSIMHKLATEVQLVDWLEKLLSQVPPLEMKSNTDDIENLH